MVAIWSLICIISDGNIILQVKKGESQENFARKQTCPRTMANEAQAPLDFRRCLAHFPTGKGRKFKEGQRKQILDKEKGRVLI
jgi:hypothetical protein